MADKSFFGCLNIKAVEIIINFNALFMKKERRSGNRCNLMNPQIFFKSHTDADNVQATLNLFDIKNIS